MFQDRVVELGLGKGFDRWREIHLGAGLAVGLSGNLKRSRGIAVVKPHGIYLTVSLNREVKLRRQGVHDRDANAM